MTTRPSASNDPTQHPAPAPATAAATAPVTAPVPAKRPTTRTHHGETVMDPYEWLRDKDDPEVLAHLTAENAWTQARTAHLAGLRAQLVSEYRAHTQEDDLSVPVRIGGWWYFSRTRTGAAYSIQVRCPVTDPERVPSVETLIALPGEEVVLDLNVLAEGEEFFALGTFDVTEDGAFLLYSTDTAGDERFTLHVRDLATGTDLPDTVEEVGAGAFFDATGTCVYYTTMDEAWRPDRLWRHIVGTPTQTDEVVLEEADERFWLGAGLTRSRAFVLVEAGSKVTSETWLIDARDPQGRPVSVLGRTEGVEYQIDHLTMGGQDALVVLHNGPAGGNPATRATDFEIGTLQLADGPVQGADRGDDNRPLATWDQVRTVVAHVPGRRLDDIDAFAQSLVVSYRHNATTQVAVLAATSLADLVAAGADGLIPIPFDEELFTVGVGANPDFHANRLRLSYTSFVTPVQVLEVDFATGERVVLKQHPVPGYNPALYHQERLWATAPDGARVPISLVSRVDRPAGPGPLIVYGYGAYEASIDPEFRTTRLSALDRGVAYAVAHVRGGGEMGRAWYEGGRLANKPNTFTDFNACTRALQAAGWGAPSSTVAWGGSAGGLLMGAALNLAPELYAGVVADVPFVDALTSILDPSLPLTVVEWDEWGDPLHNPEIYAVMRAYSPYENVRDGAPYPPVLAMTSLNDTRVLFVEPTKWVARLREAGADALLHIEMTAGHGGVTGRYAQWDETAFEYAWALDRMGLATTPTL